MKKLSILLNTLILLSVSTIYSQSLVDYEEKITEHTLTNGLQFIILEDKTAPVITVHVHVNTGSVDEKYGETGILHVIEHLAFNGTAKIGTKDWDAEKKLFNEVDSIYEELLKTRMTNENTEKIQRLQQEFERLNSKANEYAVPNEFGKILEMHGASGLNAYTSYDMTAYWVELPSNKIELWASLESDRLFNPVFRGFYEEMEVIKEERRMRVDNSPWGKLMEEFHLIAYSVHPYRNPIIGYPADLEYMTRTKVKDFYKKYYLPANIVIAIVGDINPSDLIPLLERYFKDIPPGKRVENFIPTEPPRKDTVRKTIIFMDSEPIFLTGFHIPDITHPDIPALDICAEILAGGRTSRLYKRLIKDELSALSTGAWCRTPKYPGLFYIWAIAAKGHSNIELEDAITDEILKIQNGEITDTELEGAKARLKMSLLVELRERRGLAEQLAWYKTVTGDWRDLFRYSEQLDNLTVEEIVAVAKKYMDNNNRIIGTVERKSKTTENTR